MADYAVIIGVSPYAQGVLSGPLHGTVADIQAMYDWAIEPQGGGFPVNNVIRVGPTPFGQFEPTQTGLFNAFNRLRAMALEGRSRNDRLLIYASGHGLSAHELWTSGLVVQEAVKDDPRNVSLTQLWSYFVSSGVFRDVVLLMDSCRTHLTNNEITPAISRWFSGGTRTPAPNTFIGWAVHWNGTAYEKPARVPTARGQFTKALLEAFEHAGENPGDDLTGEMVREYVNVRLAGWMTKDKRMRPPEWKRASDVDVVLGRTKANPFPLKFRTTNPVGLSDARFELDGDAANTVTFPPGKTDMTIELPLGLHRLVIPSQGLRKVIRVPCDLIDHADL